MQHGILSEALFILSFPVQLINREAGLIVRQSHGSIDFICSMCVPQYTADNNTSHSAGMTDATHITCSNVELYILF